MIRSIFSRAQKLLYEIARESLPTYQDELSTMKQLTNANSHADTIIGRVEAALNYIAVTAEKPVTLMYKIENGEPQRTYKSIKHRVTILNGRAVNDIFSLDHQAFALVHHPTAMGDFYDDAGVRAV
jgi:hypothetical protein